MVTATSPAGLGFHYGAEALGCAVIPVAGGFTERQVPLITDFKPDIIGVTTTVRVVPAGTIERSQGKAKRVIDKRPKI